MKKLDVLIESGEFPSASEAVRYALNNLIDRKVSSVLRERYGIIKP